MTMNTSQLSKLIPILIVVALVGCQPKQESSKETAKLDIPLIQAKVIPVKLPKQKVCLEDGCTNYDLQTVETNQKWIDEYFVNRMKKLSRMLLLIFLIRKLKFLQMNLH